MNDSKTFSYQAFNNRKFLYEVHENGLIFQPDSDAQISFGWKDIQYIEDQPGDRVDIFNTDRKEIPVSYTTQEFPVLLKTICLKLAEIRKGSFNSHKFKITRQHMLHLGFVAAVLALSLLGSLWGGITSFLIVLPLIVPVGIFVLRQPTSLTLFDRYLTVHDLIYAKTIHYSEIQTIDFEVKRNDYGSTLCILIQLKNRNKMTIKKIENIVLFFIMLEIKLVEDQNSGLA